MVPVVRVLTVGISFAAIGLFAAGSDILGTADAVASPVAVVAATAEVADVVAAHGPVYSLPNGLTLPPDTTPLESPTRSVTDRGMTRWEVRLDLGHVSGPVALRSLATQLRMHGWQIEGGTQDFVAVRKVGDRWQLVVARWPAPRSTSTHTLGVGIGTRPA